VGGTLQVGGADLVQNAAGPHPEYAANDFVAVTATAAAGDSALWRIAVADYSVLYDEKGLIFDEKKNRLSGVVVAGVGHLFGNGFYSAIEIGCNFSQDLKSEKEKVALKSKGISPEVNVLLGVVVGRCLVYGKAGIHCRNLSVSNAPEYTNAAFTCGGGVAFAFGNVNLRVEGNFIKGKTYQTTVQDHRDLPTGVVAAAAAGPVAGFVPGANVLLYTRNIKVEQKNSFNVRVMCVVHVNNL
jgi:hypothetical protein